MKNLGREKLARARNEGNERESEHNARLLERARQDETVFEPTASAV